MGWRRFVVDRIKESPMSFQIGDWVVLPVHGVGRIVKIDERNFFGVEIRRYYEVETPKSTIWVPTEPSDATRMRVLTVKSDLAQHRSLLKSRPTPLNKDRRQRHLDLINRLKQGSFSGLCEVVRDLTAFGWDKPLNEVDTASLRQACENLCEEWAAVEGMSVDEVNRELEALLLEGRQAFQPEP